MTGMGHGVSLRNEVVTSHFISALFFDLAILIGLVAVVVALVLVGRRGPSAEAVNAEEQPARRVLRLGAGGLWIAAGLLQLQTSMPMGIPAQVVRPSVATAPGWASWPVLQATDAWIRHPILGATGVVWVELGLGLWLVLARRGWLSRLAGGQVSVIRGPAPAFDLTDAGGRAVSLSDFAGRVVVLSFIDPVCTSECPIEAQEMRIAASKLGPDVPVSFVAINANPRFTSPSDLAAFNEAEGLTGWRNWTFLTGSPAQLRRVWDRYGVSVSTIGAGAMALHSEPVFIIDGRGQLRATWTLASGESPSSLEGQSTTSQLIDQVRRAR